MKDILEAARQAQIKGHEANLEVRDDGPAIQINGSMKITQEHDSLSVHDASDTKISFNQHGDIICEWATGAYTLTHGMVWLTREQAVEAQQYGWRTTEVGASFSSMGNLVKVERQLSFSINQQVLDTVAQYKAVMTPHLHDLEFTIAKLDCRPGDTVVFKVRGIDELAHLNPELVSEMVERARTLIPEGVKVLLMDKETDIAVIRCDDSVQC
jgi:hypothetical protein